MVSAAAMQYSWITPKGLMRKAGAIVSSVCLLAATAIIVSEWLVIVPVQAATAQRDKNKDNKERSNGGSATPPQIKYQKEPLSRDVLARTSFAPVVKRVAPSVVTIYSTKNVENRFRNSPLFDDPFFRRFFGFGDGDDERGDGSPPPPGGGRRRPGGGGGGRGGGRQFQEQSLGSGVIVSSDGYILSNNHVVEGADEVKVSLGEGRADLVAKVIGTDPPTDISVLKVDAKDLTPVTITDSANLQVGDTVLAVGNPFGVGQTVTMGIVSAVGRGGFGIVDYEDFIQTDASINPGNSGGALVDVEGRLIGVNTAIISGTGGNMGIGFAVPANMARSVMDRIIKDGRVIRGFLGVGIQPVTPELAQMFNLPNQSGALVSEVRPKTPAATKVKLKLIREDKDKKKFVDVPLSVTLGELPTEQLALRGGGRDRDSGPASSEVLEGLGVADLDNRTRNQYKVPDEVRGALAMEVAPGSAGF